jgi:Thaumatin family
MQSRSKGVFLLLLIPSLAGCSDDESSSASDEAADEGEGESPDVDEGEGADGGEDGSTIPLDGDYPCRAEADGKTTAVFINRCASPLEVRGSDIADASVDAGTYACRDLGTDVEELPSKRYWGFIGEDPGGEHHTLAEFTFNTDFNDFDWYNISHVDAHNLTMQIVPLDRPDCATLTCTDPGLLADCPEVGLWTDAEGTLISCVSPDRDNPESPVAAHFESCDDAYAWSGDDQQGEDPSPVRACAGEDWAIVFCP